MLINKLAVIDEFSKEAKLSKEIKHRLRHALTYSTEKTGFSWNDKQSIFNELPKILKYEVAMAMHQGAAKDIKFFEDKDQVLIASVVPFLNPIFIKRGDYVYSKAEYADEIYFVVKGRVSIVFGKEELCIKSFQRGSYFGEIEVIHKIPRRYSVKAIRDSELLVMKKAVRYM